MISTNNPKQQLLNTIPNDQLNDQESEISQTRDQVPIMFRGNAFTSGVRPKQRKQNETITNTNNSAIMSPMAMTNARTTNKFSSNYAFMASGINTATNNLENNNNNNNCFGMGSPLATTCTVSNNMGV